MNQTNIFVHSAQTFQFLSVLSYMNTLSDIFYDVHLLESEDKFREIPIINAYFDYLNNTSDKANAKRHLARKFLEDSDLYGGNENNTLDMEYIDATFEYIISNILFTDYGNVYGYLAKIVNLSNNFTLSFLKQTMLEDLTKLKYFNPDGTISKLSLLSSVGIRDDILWPLFPQPERDMNVTDIDFVYAQAGLIFSHSAQLNCTNMSFHNYIILAQTLELTVLQNATDESALMAFTLPALLFRASKKAEKFNQEYLSESVHDERFLAETLEFLFSHLNETFLRIGQKEQEDSPLYQFTTALSEFKNRTRLAEDFLRQRCRLNESEYEAEIDKYKLYASSSKCPDDDSVLLPNVDEIFQNQIDQIQEKFRILLDGAIRVVLYEAKLVELINSTDTSVFESQAVPIPVYCFPSPCPPYQPRLNPNSYLFALRRQDGDFYYALINNGDNFTLLSRSNDPADFLNKAGLSADTALEISPIATVLKRTFETFETFVDRLARLKAREFGAKLHSTGYEKTFKEKAVDVVLALIPFYNCVRFAKAGDNVGLTFACMSDAISWIPFAGQLMQLGGKLGSVALNHLLMAAGVSVRTFAARQAISVTLKAGLYEAASGIGGTVKQVILTKETFKSLSLGFVRAVDPGFEILGRLHWKAAAKLGKLFKKTWTTAARRFSFLSTNAPKYENLWQQLGKSGLHSKDESGMIPVSLGQMDGYEVFRYTYPGGAKPFGPKFVRLPTGNAELRRVIGFKGEVPVVVSRMTKRGKMYYKKFDLKTKDTYGLELELNQDNLLHPVGPSFREHIGVIMREGLSGRGQIRVQRDKCINEAVSLISKSDIALGRESFSRLIRHYVLAVERPMGMEVNLANVIVDAELINQVDDVNPDTLDKYLGEDRLVVDPSLNNYLIVPTYEDFALDFIRTKNIPGWYESFYVRESIKLEILRGGIILDFTRKNELEECRTTFVKLYGSNFEEMVQHNLETIFDMYDSGNARKFVSFEDYVGILIYVRNMNEISVNKNMEIALYRFVVRQTDDDVIDFPKKLFCLEDMTLERFQKDVMTFVKGYTLRTDIFLRTTTDENFLHSKAIDIVKKNLVPVKYEIELDSQFLAVNLNLVIPTNEEQFVIPSNVEFVIDDVIKENDVVIVKIYNKPVTKELWLVKLMREIKKVQRKQNT